MHIATRYAHVDLEKYQPQYPIGPRDLALVAARFQAVFVIHGIPLWLCSGYLEPSFQRLGLIAALHHLGAALGSVLAVDGFGCHKRGKVHLAVIAALKWLPVLGAKSLIRLYAQPVLADDRH